MTKARIDSRPLSYCCDDSGNFTPNPLLTGRLVSLSKVEILVGALYLEGKLKLTAANFLALSDLEAWVSGGRLPFIIGMDANMDASEWQQFWWGSRLYTDHLAAEIVGIKSPTSRAEEHTMQREAPGLTTSSCPHASSEHWRALKRTTRCPLGRIMGRGSECQTSSARSSPAS